MKFSMVQMAALALALRASAAPAFEKRDCDEDTPGFGRNTSGNAHLSSGLRPSSGFGNSGNVSPSGFANLNVLKAAAASSSTTKKSSKTTTTKASRATTTDSSDNKASATDDSGSEATATATDDSSAVTSTKASKSSAARSSSATTTTKASSTGGSSGSSGGSLLASSGTSVLSAAQTIAAGDSFDGGMVMFDRGVTCTGQAEGGDSDAVFQIENGGSISNVIIGPNQIEGIHCQGACTLTNVWWSAVCEDAFTVKNQDAGETTKIIGGGAFGADDKVVQHNGAGTISISDFTVDAFGKLYRSCGNCDSMYERHIIMDGITATDGTMLAGINSNYGDSATITNSIVTGVDDVCVTFTGTDDNSQEPTENGSGNDGTYCIYGTDVTVS